MAAAAEGATGSLISRYSSTRGDCCSGSAIPITEGEFNELFAHLAEPVKTIIRKTVFGSDCFCAAIKNTSGVPQKWKTVYKNYKHPRSLNSNRQNRRKMAVKTKRKKKSQKKSVKKPSKTRSRKFS